MTLGAWKTHADRAVAELRAAELALAEEVVFRERARFVLGAEQLVRDAPPLPSSIGEYVRSASAVILPMNCQ